MCDKFWCIWSISYNDGDSDFAHDENCTECDVKSCEICGHYYELEGGCEYESKQGTEA